MELMDLDLLNAVRADPEGELERPSARLLRTYLMGGETLRAPRGRDLDVEADADPSFVSWVCNTYFGEPYISYWSWDGVATLLSPTALGSFRLALEWIDEYYTEYPIRDADVDYEVRDRLVGDLGIARARPALLFGNAGPDPWTVQAFLRGYSRACQAARVDPDPVFSGLMGLGIEFRRKLGLKVQVEVSWARAVGFTRSGFEAGDAEWFPALIQELEQKHGVTVLPRPFGGAERP